MEKSTAVKILALHLYLVLCLYTVNLALNFAYPQFAQPITDNSSTVPSPVSRDHTAASAPRDDVAAATDDVAAPMDDVAAPTDDVAAPINDVAAAIPRHNVTAPAPMCDHKQEARKSTIRETCKTLKGSHKVARGFQMVVDREHKVLYCHVPKAGCTTLLAVLEAATAPGNKTHLTQPHLVHVNDYMRSVGLTQLQSHPAWMQRHILANYTKLLVVRHPINRLISAYYDKMTRMPTEDKYYSQLRMQVIQTQRHNYTRHDLSSTWPTFQEFIRQRLDASWGYHDDRHWEQMHRLCSPCAVDYDYVLKLESLGADTRLFLQPLTTPRTPLPHLEALVRVRNANGHVHYSARDKSVAHEFLTLTAEERQALMKMYELDMKLFGYTIDDAGKMDTHDLTQC